MIKNVTITCGLMLCFASLQLNAMKNDYWTQQYSNEITIVKVISQPTTFSSSLPLYIVFKDEGALLVNNTTLVFENLEAGPLGAHSIVLNGSAAVLEIHGYVTLNFANCVPENFKNVTIVPQATLVLKGVPAWVALNIKAIDGCEWTFSADGNAATYVNNTAKPVVLNLEPLCQKPVMQLKHRAACCIVS